MTEQPQRPPSPKRSGAAKKTAPRPTGASSAPPTSTPPPSAPTAALKPEPVLAAPEGFQAVGDRLIAMKDILVTVVPHNAKRTSTVLLWTQGTSITRAEYDKRLDLYAGYSNLEYK